MDFFKVNSMMTLLKPNSEKINKKPIKEQSSSRKSLSKSDFYSIHRLVLIGNVFKIKKIKKQNILTKLRLESRKTRKTI